MCTVPVEYSSVAAPEIATSYDPTDPWQDNTVLPIPCPGTRPALVWLREHDRPVAGATVNENVTEPLNPYNPATVSPFVPEAPGVRMIGNESAGGLTVSEKSGLGTVRTIVVESIRVPLVAVTTTA